MDLDTLLQRALSLAPASAKPEITRRIKRWQSAGR